MKWFGNHWEGSEHTFPAENQQQNSTTYILKQKLSETSAQKSQETATSPGSGPSSAWAVFLCEKKNEPGLRYVMNIYMQCAHATLYQTIHYNHVKKY